MGTNDANSTVSRVLGLGCRSQVPFRRCNSAPVLASSRVLRTYHGVCRDRRHHCVRCVLTEREFTGCFCDHDHSLRKIRFVLSECLECVDAFTAERSIETRLVNDANARLLSVVADAHTLHSSCPGEKKETYTRSSANSLTMRRIRASRTRASS